MTFDNAIVYVNYSRSRLRQCTTARSSIVNERERISVLGPINDSQGVTNMAKTTKS